jgi:hypothetical protein
MWLFGVGEDELERYIESSSVRDLASSGSFVTTNKHRFGFAVQSDAIVKGRAASGALIR